MPRKRQSIPILRIERLSTGRVYQANPGIDDFTGQPIEPAVDTTPLRPIPDPDIARDQAKRERRDNQLMMLQAIRPSIVPEHKRVALPTVASKPVAQHIPGKRAVVIGNAMSIHLPLPPWRRG